MLCSIFISSEDIVIHKEREIDSDREDCRSTSKNMNIFGGEEDANGTGTKRSFCSFSRIGLFGYQLKFVPRGAGERPGAGERLPFVQLEVLRGRKDRKKSTKAVGSPFSVINAIVAAVFALFALHVLLLLLAI